MRRTSLIALAALVAAVTAAALAARYQIIQPADAALACQSATAPWWCGLRAGLVALFPWSGFGWVSVAAGVLALAWRPAGGLALCAGAAGLVLYDAETAAVGVVLGLIAVSRRGATPEPATEPAAPEAAR